MRYAMRMKQVRGSEIRDVGKKISARNNPDLIRFSAGLPDAALFPMDALRDITDDLMWHHYEEAFQYGPTKGEEELLALLAERMRKNENIDVRPEEILVTTGCQQGISLASMAFLDKGDIVVVEKPSYMDGLNACIPFECEFIGIRTDEEGMVLEDLERVLKENPKVKMIYVIPNFQNPTGKAWSFHRRKAFMEVVNRFDVLVLEDNPYGEIRFKGAFIPTLKSMDTQGNVLYLSSFSKVLSPGLRLAWACGTGELIEKLEILKEGIDLQSNEFAQIQAILYLHKYDLDAHIQTLRDAYQKKCEVMLKTMERYFPNSVKYTKPEGGMFLWVELPEQINTSDLLDRALDAGVAYIPGGSFYANGGGTNGMRLNFTAVSEEQIVKGVQILAAVFAEVLK